MFALIFAGVFGMSRRCFGVLNPAAYSSPSGRFTLEVDPGEIDGQGEGSYQLKRNGNVVWSRKYPFTLCEAAVTDEGVAAGYAYQNGRAGFAPGGLRADPTAGTLNVVILGPDGALRMNAAAGRQFKHLDARRFRLVRGMFIDSVRGRLIVRVQPEPNERGERWWVYDLAAGKELTKIDFEQKDPALRFVIRIAPVRDTPLLLMHWWHSDDALPPAKNPGGAFTLIDPSDLGDIKTGWKKVLAGDYAFTDTPEDPWRSSRLQDDILRDKPPSCNAISRGDFRSVSSRKTSASALKLSRAVASPGGRFARWRARRMPPRRAPCLPPFPRRRP